MLVRRAQTTDIPAMMLVEQLSPTAAHWSRDQYNAFFVNTGTQLSEGVAWVAAETAGPPIVAFLAARRVGTEWELENIVVAQHMRRRGVAQALLDGLIAHARTEGGTAIFLEVRESNRSARALYRKGGFGETGLRKSYYSNPAEDAIVFCLLLI